MRRIKGRCERSRTGNEEVPRKRVGGARGRQPKKFVQDTARIGKSPCMLRNVVKKSRSKQRETLPNIHSVKTTVNCGRDTSGVGRYEAACDSSVRIDLIGTL